MEEKQPYGLFKQKNKKITHNDNLDLVKRNLRRETESQIIVFQNNAIRNNYILTKFTMLKNSKCTLWSDRDEMFNHIINEYSKLAQREYKIRQDWVGNMSY